MIYLTKKNYRLENYLIFILSILLFNFNELIFSNLYNPKLHYFFNSYFNDLLAPFLLFSYINLLLSIIDKELYSFKYLFLIIILCSFLWEYLVLFLKPTAISDPLDILFYFSGTFIYWIIHKFWIQKHVQFDHF